MASACSQRASGNSRARSIAASIFSAFFCAEDARLFRGAEIELGELFAALRQGEKIERIVDQAALDQLVRDDAAEAFDIERIALGEILQAARFLRGAEQVFATPDRELRVAPDGAAARRTFAAEMREEVERRRVRAGSARPARRRE